MDKMKNILDTYEISKTVEPKKLLIKRFNFRL
jgi:hypothetical protein